VIKKIIKRVVSTTVSSVTGPFAMIVGLVNFALTAYDTAEVVSLINQYYELKEKINLLLTGVPYKEIVNLLNLIEIPEEKFIFLERAQHNLLLCKIERKDCKILNYRYRVNDDIEYVTGKLVFYFSFYENAFLLKNKIVTKVPIEKDRFLVLILDKNYENKIVNFFNLLKSSSYSNFLEISKKYKILVKKEGKNFKYLILFKLREKYPNSFIEIYYEPKIEELKEFEQIIGNLSFNNSISFIYKETFFYLNEKKIDILFNESLKCFEKVIEKDKEILKEYKRTLSKLVNYKNEERIKKLSFFQWFLDYSYLYFLEENRNCDEINKKLKEIVKDKTDLLEDLNLEIENLNKDNSLESLDMKISFLNVVLTYLDFYFMNCDYKNYILEDVDFLVALYEDFLKNKNLKEVENHLIDLYTCDKPKIEKNDFIKVISMKNLLDREINLATYLALREKIIEKSMSLRKEEDYITMFKKEIEKVFNDKKDNQKNNNRINLIDYLAVNFDLTYLSELYEKIENSE